MSRTPRFVVGLVLAGMAAFAALGAEIPPTNGTPEMIKLHDISARLDRIERLLREMCERTARFGGCEELRKQR